MKKKALTLILLEDGYKETELVQSTASLTKSLIVIGHAQSELRLIRMLKEFMPDILLMKASMLSYEFLLRLYPLLNNSQTKILIYSHSFHDENSSAKLFKKLKYNVPYSFLHMRPTDKEDTLCEKIIFQLKKFSSKGEKKQVEEEKAISYDGKANSLIIIGSSAGGPRILKNIILQLPPRIPTALVIVQHISHLFSQTLVESLSQNTDIQIKEADDGEIIYNNHIYIARGDHHLEIQRQNGNKCFHVHRGPKIWSVRPAIDVTMISAVQVFKDRIIAVILTGIGQDGAKGIKVVKKAGGKVIAQDEATSMVFGMPGSAIETGCVDYVLPYYKIADVSVNLLSQR